MKIQVLLFGIATDLVGINSLELELNEQTTVSEFKSLLQTKYPKLVELDSYAVAVNESYATNDSELKENDVIAVIPPVSGG